MRHFTHPLFLWTIPYPILLPQEKLVKQEVKQDRVEIMKKNVLTPPTSPTSIIRIAPVCNGKIYVTPHPTDKEASASWDLPIEEQVEQFSPKSEKAVRKIKERYSSHLHTSATPRYCVKYRSAQNNGQTVYLYVLPLRKEDEISFHNGQFVTAEKINDHPEQYSVHLGKESELLSMAAELWKDFLAS